MAMSKIERIDKEIQKTREKITEYQNRLRGLEAQKTEAENLQIVQLVRSIRRPLTNWKQRLRREKRFPLLTWLTRSKPIRSAARASRKRSPLSGRSLKRIRKRHRRKPQRKQKITIWRYEHEQIYR